MIMLMRYLLLFEDPDHAHMGKTLGRPPAEDEG